MKEKLTLSALILALGFIFAALTLGKQFKNMRPVGSVTVKGLAEMPYRADLATWEISIYSWGSDYKIALDNTKEALPVLQNFLKPYGFETEEPVIDIYQDYEEYTDEHGNRQSRPNGYNGKYTILVRSKDLDKITKAWNEAYNLRAEQSGVSFSQPRYYISNLEKVKLDLITKATQDAKNRAEKFVKNNGAKVKNLKSASQGSFNIYAANSNNEDSDYGGVYDTSTIDKIVRLVVTMEYGIE